jgi:hypothetical protein
MEAKEMFEKLGYKLYQKSDKIIEYRTSEHLPYDRVNFSITLKSFNTVGKTGQCNPSYKSIYLPLANAIIQQMKELNWL